jgi:hypothetical protein
MDKNKLNKFVIILFPAGIIFFILFLYFFAGIDNVIAAIWSMDPVYYLSALIFTFLSMFVFSLTWWYLLRVFSADIPYLKTFQYMWVANFVDILIPAETVSGDLVKTYLATKALNGKTGEVVASIVAHKILSIFIPLICLVFSLITIMLEMSLPPLFLNFVLLTTIGTSITLAFLFIFSLNEKAAEKILNKIFDLLGRILGKRLNTDSLKSKVQTFLNSFSHAIQTLSKSPTTIICASGLALIAWVLDLLAYYLVFIAIGVKISPAAIVMVYSIISTVQLIPFGSPGWVGPMEIIMTGLFIPFGLSISLSAAATILIRLVTLWFKFLIGGIMVQWTGFEFILKKNEKQ